MRINSNRSSIRVTLDPRLEIKGIVTDLNRAMQTEFVLVDISNSGMGIITQHMIDVNSKVKLAIGQPHLLIFEGVVVWCIEEQAHYRIGIKIEKGVSQLSILYEEFRNKMENYSD